MRPGRAALTKCQPRQGKGRGGRTGWGKMILAPDFDPFQQLLSPTLLLSLEMGPAFLAEEWPLVFLNFQVGSFQMNPVTIS